jgi:hypothetical protein
MQFVWSFSTSPLLQQPEVCLSNIAELFNDRGEVIGRGTKDFLQTFAGAFARRVRLWAKTAGE